LDRQGRGKARVPQPADADESAGHDTRRKVIDAAIRCILDQGFYRASSNAIAETAGLSWGVIQYYFGSREALMLAVLEEGTRRLTDELGKADITGETMTDRLEQYFMILEGYYGRPEYLAFVQVLLNLSHDPRTSARAVETISQVTAAVDEDLHRLTNKLFEGTGIRRPALRAFPFHVLRGLALSEVMLRTLPYDTAKMVEDVSDQRRLLAKAVALLIQSESPKGDKKPPGRRAARHSRPAPAR
jgi:TetR/AcrR family transcriptional regulator, regulator of cefoperazone and chloramphenicol sensitivity